MISIKTSPKNKKYFKKVKKLAKEIVEIYREIGIEPVAYGGLVYFGYTRDKNAVIHDIDLLVPEKSLGKVAEILKDRKIRYHWNPERHDFKIYREGAKVELDSIEGYCGKGRIKDEFDFDGLKVRAVSLDSLINTYRGACKESRGKHKQHVKRYEELLKLKIKC